MTQLDTSPAVADYVVLILLAVGFLSVLYVALGAVVVVEWVIEFHRRGRRRIEYYDALQEAALDRAVVRWALVHGHRHGKSEALDRIVREAQIRERRLHPLRVVTAHRMAPTAGSWSALVDQWLDRPVNRPARRGCFRYAPPGT